MQIIASSQLDKEICSPYLEAMSKHPHAPAIERIGRAALMGHFNISRQAISLWTRNGVPKLLLNSVRTLAAVNGVPAPELYEGEAK